MPLRSILTLLVAISFAALFSQAPEFMQQYYQRIGGAVDELQRITNQFDDNARKLGHDRTSALGIMSSNPQPLIQGLAQLEKGTAERLERLGKQRAYLKEARSFDRFTYLMTNYDPPLARATWRAFEPAIPLTQAGLGFAFAGFALSLLSISGIGFAVRRFTAATA